MTERYQKNTATILGSILIGLIIISFAFSGYESMRGTSDVVAKIGKYPISIREFQMEYERQLSFYRQIMGGNLTSKQIEGLNLKSRVISSLQRSKLMNILGDKLVLTPSAEEVKQAIKELPYFKSNERFDLELYKKILASNRLTPGEFEENISEDLKRKKVQDLLRQLPTSHQYLAALGQFKAQTITANIVQINKRELKNHLPVSPQEVASFTKDSKNLERLKLIFEETKSKYDQPEQVHAKHLLIKSTDENDENARKKIEEIAKKLTPQNFNEMAKKYSEDPSVKQNGGDLGFFARGRMMPEFEEAAFSLTPGKISEPIRTAYGHHLILVLAKKPAISAKFDNLKNQLAIEVIRNGKQPEIEKLSKQLQDQVKKMLDADNSAGIKAIRNQYNLNMDEKTSISLLDGNKGAIQLRPNQLDDVFKQKAMLPKTIVFEGPTETLVIRLSKYASTPISQKEREDLMASLTQSFEQDLVKKLDETVRTKYYGILKNI